MHGVAISWPINPPKTRATTQEKCVNQPLDAINLPVSFFVSISIKGISVKEMNQFHSLQAVQN